MRWWALVLAACGSTAPVEEAPPSAVKPTVVAAPPVEVVKPVVVAPGRVPEAARVQGWLQEFNYRGRGWTPMTELRATGEHGGERLYFNDVLAASWRAGAQEHPLGSAAVRELWSGDLMTLKGFALMHKTGASGDVGEGWFWFEVFGTTADARPTVAEAGARGCVGCHSHAVDFVHSPETPRMDPQPLL